MQPATELDFFEVATVLVTRWRLLTIGPLAAAAVAVGGSFLIEPTFTASTVFLPPQQQQVGAAAALASLGSLASLAGGAGGKSQAEQYVALLQSVTISDRIIDAYGLQEIYDAKYRSTTRLTLSQKVRVALGRREGLITIEVDDSDPERAAKIANSYVSELRRMTSELAVTEAQQRRAFFEGQLNQTRAKLVAAQIALQGSGINAGAIKAEPKAAAEAYAKLRAEVTVAEVRVQTLRSYLNDSAAELQQALSMLAALRSQLTKQEAAVRPDGDTGASYIGKYRDFKYQETLFELFSRQFELAKVDEAKEGALIQVVDAAMAPDRKSKPKRSIFAMIAFFGTAFALASWLLARLKLQRIRLDPVKAAKLDMLRQAAKRSPARSPS